MDDLTMDLVRICKRNRDGSYGTQNNRQRGLNAIATELRDLGYKLPNATSIKPKHVDALVEKWLGDDKTEATIRNRLTWLRWWAEKVNKPGVVRRDNAAYGLNEAGAPQRNRAQRLDHDRLNTIPDKYIQGSLLLQSAFGLRREEAIKFRPKLAIYRDHIHLLASWTKGGKSRSIEITTLEQRHVLEHVSKLVQGDGSLIPADKNYVEQLRRYEYHTLTAGLRNTHGLRHQYAQQRYKTLTGWDCPLAGGKLRKDMTKAEQEADRAARFKISAELGHGRLKITDTYLGSAAS